MQNTNFSDRGNFILLWKIRSKELYDSACVVWNECVLNPPNGPRTDAGGIHLLYRPAMLLMGLSLEVQLKALIMTRAPLQKGCVDFPKKLASHKLVPLFQDAKLPIDSNESIVLERLTAAIEWTSKYPTPRRASGLNPAHLIRNDGDFDAFKILHGRVEEELKLSGF